MSSIKQSNAVYSLDVQGNLDVAYKKMAITALYGMIQGNAHSAAEQINHRCKREHIRKPEQIIVTQQDKLITMPGMEIDSKIWVGRIEMRITDGENEFWVYRDWFEEIEIDKLHPMYDDDWFYESSDCENYKRWKSLFEQHNIEWKEI